MNGTVRIERWSVTVEGRTTRIRGPFADPETREILRRRARAILGGQSFGWGEFDQIAFAAHASRPTGDPRLNDSSSSVDQPRDASLDNWGRRRGSMAEWVDGNCLRLALATALQRQGQVGA